LQAARDPITLPESTGAGKFKSFVGVFSAESLVQIIDSSQYIFEYGERSVKPKTAFYRHLIENGTLSDFLIIVPQLTGAGGGIQEIQGVGPRAVVSRDRRGGVEGSSAKSRTVNKGKLRSILRTPTRRRTCSDV